MQKKQRPFTREFKREAVQLAKTSGKPMIQIAKDLGIADSTLHHGVRSLTSMGCKHFLEAGIKRFQKK
jgi:transposase